jgi:hypothetical protein
LVSFFSFISGMGGWVFCNFSLKCHFLHSFP